MEYKLAKEFGISLASKEQEKLSEEIISNYFKGMKLTDALIILDLLHEAIEGSAVIS